jgi:hypothetical protein
MGEQLICTFDAVLDLFAAGFADLAPHLAMCAGDADQWRRIGMKRKLGFW